MTLRVDCQSHLIQAILTGRGPWPDIDQEVPLLSQLPGGFQRVTIVADVGFNSAFNPRFLRQEQSIRLIAPPTHGSTRKHSGPPSDVHRRHMHHLLKTRARRRRGGFTQRWQVETVNGMIIRNLTDELSSRGYPSPCCELRRLAIIDSMMV